MQIGQSVVDQVTPTQAWSLLEADPSAQLVDVRSRAEWTFVGIPDLSALDRTPWLIEWAAFPDMTPRASFVHDVEARVAEVQPTQLLFLCRSGARSLSAAMLVAERSAAMGQALVCTNVGEGFQGDLDSAHRRGGLNGWQAVGLPWRQT
ncbi:MAG: rhodanese-like domain-containing protein [Pseudomonadota bacterium]